jgi:hypothetical protein
MTISKKRQNKIEEVIWGWKECPKELLYLEAQTFPGG